MTNEAPLSELDAWFLSICDFFLSNTQKLWNLRIGAYFLITYPREMLFPNFERGELRHIDVFLIDTIN